MADNFSFKDASRTLLSRASKELTTGVYANKDIPVWEDGTHSDVCNNAKIYNVLVTDADEGITLIEANSNRKGLLIQSRHEQADLFIAYGNTINGNTASVIIPSREYWEMPKPIFRGSVKAIAQSGFSFYVFVTELF